jgi:hypothetical protein
MTKPLFPEDTKDLIHPDTVKFGKWEIQKYMGKDRYHITARLVGEQVTVVNSLAARPMIVIDRSVNYAGNQPEMDIFTYWGFASNQSYMLAQGERTFSSSPVYLMRFISEGGYFRISSGETLMDGAKENLIFMLVNYDTLYLQRFSKLGNNRQFYEVLRFDTSEFHSLIKKYPELWPEANEMENAAFVNRSPAPEYPRPFTSNDPACFIVKEKIFRQQIYK